MFQMVFIILFGDSCWFFGQETIVDGFPEVDGSGADEIVFADEVSVETSDFELSFALFGVFVI